MIDLGSVGHGQAGTPAVPGRSFVLYCRRLYQPHLESRTPHMSLKDYPQHVLHEAGWHTRGEDHFYNALRYIENNPVRAKLCSKPSDWPFSSAWFRERGGKPGAWMIKCES